ncbi:MerR family transcriptional regulator [Sutcliffiella cohnii]|uniref:MerR family transcriptional regulator n=1 Tax=Sutcliffiella cohnii TaxID=33932 RepID=UPI002E1C444A|nr:MerR family transcriptional regulator [Sutcliffiella cohnii]MED4018560.1 MerR family transcriptional regulator [Sutcliffiella cohnii]
MNDFGYFAKDVASELGVTTSTLRRWSIQLEKKGYFFERNDKDQRIYYERDYKAFRELKQLLNKSVPFINAVNVVISKNLVEKNAPQTPSVFEEEVRLSKRELEELVHQSVQKAIEKERELIIDVIEKKLENVIENRDKLITLELQKSLEQRQNEIAATEEKQSWWKRLFKQ